MRKKDENYFDVKKDIYYYVNKKDMQDIYYEGGNFYYNGELVPFKKEGMVNYLKEQHIPYVSDKKDVIFHIQKVENKEEELKLIDKDYVLICDDYKRFLKYVENKVGGYRFNPKLDEINVLRVDVVVDYFDLSILEECILCNVKCLMYCNYVNPLLLLKKNHLEEFVFFE